MSSEEIAARMEAAAGAVLSADKTDEEGAE